MDPFSDGDDFIGGGDYTAVLTAWGSSYGPEPIPEPAAIGLLLGGGLVLLRNKRR